ncbi:hypothetical protein F0562_033936 [Nyssa sinensis]|uniref:Uncharacterized protein n=1 Tax=Nyssa sinensis TaxID=561372 RepID=A0A5J5AE17_9ASTE|nr:hypothetical protein F0562_033936 [Nyssa sinensis]
MLKLIQLGLTLSNEHGNLATCGTGKYCIWQFNVNEDVLPSDPIELLQGIPEQAEVPPVARAHATNPPAQPPLPAQPAPVPSIGPNANPLDPSPQDLPDMGSDAAGGGNLDFLSNSPEANPKLLWYIRNLLWQLAVTVTPEEREAIERAPQACAASLTSTAVSAAPQPSATTLAPLDFS